MDVCCAQDLGEIMNLGCMWASKSASRAISAVAELVLFCIYDDKL